ncbi:MAG: hypothetical protein EU539_04930 [Promethearchaeota archaeon]|nr:MAG: hypothetical protein EU539_04930 [Candidatus Lokiarchaeota archaeon]
MKRISELNLKTITCIQLFIATIISLIYQFVIPLNWNPLDVAMFGPDIEHGDPKRNIQIATISQWWFSFSVAWFIYRENPYVNNFLVYSIFSSGTIILLEIVLFGLFWDYIHIVPFLVNCYILWKKRDTLFQKWLPYYLILFTSWYFLVFIFDLAYFGAPIWMIVFDFVSMVILGIGLSFTFPDSIRMKWSLFPLEYKNQPHRD